MSETGWHVATGWTYGHRHVMFVSFEAETNMFVQELDSVLETSLPVLVGRLNR